MFSNLQELLKTMPSERACRRYFEQYRWEGGNPICPRCGSGNFYRIEGGMRFMCAEKECEKKYSVLLGTIFQSSKIPLSKWFTAIYLSTSRKKGISSCQLARDLGITQKSAWFMIMRIRELMREKEPLLLEGEVQGDEVYIGGVEQNKHKDKKAKDPIEAAAMKTPIVGLLQTGGNIVLRVMPWVTTREVEYMVLTHVKRKSIFVTDGAFFYLYVGKEMDHIIVDTKISHKKDGKHKNGIENAWSHFRRCIDGTYHQISDEHLQRYCDEFSYRFNTRKITDGARYEIALHRTVCRLPYKKLISESLTSWEYDTYGKEVYETPEE